ncbi:MAG: GNAT family N-acetyltransferase, partial [Acidobacteriia bacterium]|nr:GNAT family N-acetyltransferase [Terriglobia bacterium]
MCLELQEIDTLAEMEALEPQWRELWTRDPRATPFQSPDWLIPWTRLLWGGGKLRVLAFRDGGRLVALAPLFQWGLETICLSFLGSGITDYLDIVAEPEFAPLAARQLLASTELFVGCDLVDLQELRSDSPLLAEGGPPWRNTPSNVCPVLPLASSTGGLLAGLDSKFRTDLRRAENRLRRAASIEFTPATQANYLELLEALFCLHTARWEQRSNSGVLAADALRAFHRESASRFLAAGMLRLYGLIADGRPIAIQYNLAAKGRVYAYLSGFDPEWSRYSPGGVLLKHSMECAIEEHAVEFDFLRNGESF